MLPLIPVLLALSGARAGADIVAMANGDRLTGTLVTMVDGELMLETEYAGSIAVEWGKVERLLLDEPLPVFLADGAERRARELPTFEIALSDVQAVAPPPTPPPPPAKWRGRVDFGWASTSGNSRTHLATLTALAYRERLGRGRLSLLLDAASGSTEDETTADRARVQGKYDRGAGNTNYRYYLAGLGYDRIRDIDLRAELGAGFGRSLIDKPGNILTAEIGASYVRDDFTQGGAQSDAKLRLAEAWRRNLATGTSVQQSLAVLAVANEPEDFTAEFVLALSRELGGGLSLISKIVDTYDSRPAPDTERNDLTFTTQLGLAFGE